MKTSFTIASIALAISLGTAVDAACSPKYGQCGGKFWEGPTCCETGSTCVAQANNEYYSQCLPNEQVTNQPAKPVTTTKKTTTTTKKTTTTTKKSTTTTTQKATTTTQKPVATTTTTTTTVAKPAPTSEASGNYASIPGGKSGNGSTTRYWDCCKSSCSWPGKASVSGPVDTCAKNGISIMDDNTQSGCNGGSGYMCNNNQPWAVNDNLAYGFAAAHISGSNEAGWCCGCYELSFTSGPVSGKKLVVQVTNTGGDLGHNHFDLQIPGGGVGIFDGCSSQWGSPVGGWGNRYGGISSISECDALPSQLQPGCKWRFNWFKNADNPTMTFKEVTCPVELTTRSGCKRN
ncbi:RlpA-like double-psi beta-barrel-protein domain-containing protein-containing protein [Pilaira anomala]|nr:RlpA-like double-psi beta-barrel-protein domain-containing protein-containing protein [Pilaira anomala]